jgi:RimJ/RimL family protein N-acetyltransferase
MYELSQEYFYKVMPLLKDGHPHPEILSVIENNNPGWIFVDHKDSPRTALIWSKGIQGFYLIGDHNNQAFINSLNDYITKSITPRMRQLGMNYFEVSGHHDKWNLESIFASRALQQWDQQVYMLLNEPLVTDNQINILNLRSQEWKNRVFINNEFVNAHIDLFWARQDDFFNKGYGYIAIDGTEIIGVCYSSFVTKDIHAIGIETLTQYQRRGVGTALASLVVKEIVENGYAPYWDCSLKNEASKKLALRLGFQQIHQYKCIGFKI